MNCANGTFSVTEQQLNSTASPAEARCAIKEKSALLYIVVVLTMYSFGIMCMIVKYLRRSKKDIEQENIVEQIRKRRRVAMCGRYYVQSTECDENMDLDLEQLNQDSVV